MKRKILRKIESFERTFTKKEQKMIIISSLIVLILFVLGAYGIVKAMLHLLDLYIEATSPYVEKALNYVIGFFFEGWTLF